MVGVLWQCHDYMLTWRYGTYRPSNPSNGIHYSAKVDPHSESQAAGTSHSGFTLVIFSSGTERPLPRRQVRELFRVADELAPSIVFIDEIDAVGTKRYDSQSGGEKEIQRTMLELLNQMDGFDSMGDVKVIMATNRIESLDPALIRPGRIDRKIEFPLPDAKTKRRIFGIHTGAPPSPPLSPSPVAHPERPCPICSAHVHHHSQCSTITHCLNKVVTQSLAT